MLSTPPAFILSQDQTLVKSVCIQFRINILANSSLFTVVWFLTVRSTASSSKLLLCSCSLRFLKIFLLKKFSRVIVVYCSIIKVLFTVLFKRQLLYFTKSFSLCQELFYFSVSFDLAFSCPPLATACLYYHIQIILSTTFFD